MSSSGPEDAEDGAARGSGSVEQTPPASLSLLESIPDPVVVVDPVDGDVLYVNDPCEGLFGVSRDTLTERRMRTFLGVGPQFVDATDESAAEALATAVDGLEHTVETADGQRVVSVGARQASVGGGNVVLARLDDQTRQRGMVDTIQETERHLSTITSHLPVVLFTVEADGAISYIEGSGLSRLDLDPASLLQEDVFELFEGQGVVTDPLGRALGGEAIDTVLEFGGTPFQCWIRPFRDQEGDVVRAVGMALDVTVQRRRRQLLAILNRVLRHNLRNELNIVLGAADDILSTPESGEVTDQRAATVVEAAERLTRLAEKARPLAAIEWDPDRTPAHDFETVLQASVETVSDRLPEADIEVEPPPEPVTVAGVGFEYALTELLDNAVRHNPDEPSQAMVTTTLSETPGRELRVTVVDDGPGLSEMEREVLDRGWETPLHHSEGLGLWLVHCVVMSAGGALEVDATDDGTAITIELPRVGRG